MISTPKRFLEERGHRPTCGRTGRHVDASAFLEIRKSFSFGGIHIRQELERISLTVETLQLWTERMLANGQIDAETYKRKLEE